MKWFLRVLGIVVLAAASLYAFAFLIIFTARSAQATYRFETREVHPDYVFVIRTENYRFEQRNGGWQALTEVRFAEIAPSDPLTLKLDCWPSGVVEGSQWRERACLAIVPRAVAAQYKSAAECFDAGACGESDCFYWNRPVPPWYSKDASVTVTYRVQPKQSGDGLEIVQTSWSPLWQWAIVPIAGACFGIWLVRRIRRGRATHAAPEQKPTGEP